MTRIFLPPEDLVSDMITITGDNARHMALVLRIRPGERIFIFDGRGFRYECIVKDVHKKEVVAKLVSKIPCSVESPISITLAQGTPKGEKMDLIVQKSTELGVSRIIPLITQRSQVRHTQKLDRWRKIALSASRQSGRDKVPDIADPVDFGRYIASITEQEHAARQRQAGMIFSEIQEERNLREILQGFRNARRLILLVGPEGGFSPEEVMTAVESGLVEVSLGPRILRTETAPLAAVSIVQYELGDMA